MEIPALVSKVALAPEEVLANDSLDTAVIRGTPVSNRDTPSVHSIVTIVNDGQRRKMGQVVEEVQGEPLPVIHLTTISVSSSCSYNQRHIRNDHLYCTKEDWK
jgi:hypothetical protein